MFSINFYLAVGLVDWNCYRMSHITHKVCETNFQRKRSMFSNFEIKILTVTRALTVDMNEYSPRTCVSHAAWLLFQKGAWECWHHNLCTINYGATYKICSPSESQIWLRVSSWQCQLPLRIQILFIGMFEYICLIINGYIILVIMVKMVR